MSAELNLQPVLIADEWQPVDRPVGTFTATNPALGRRYPTVIRFPQSTRLTGRVAGHAAATALRSFPMRRINAAFLADYADAIEAAADRWWRDRSRDGLAVTPRPRDVNCRERPINSVRSPRGVSIPCLAAIDEDEYPILLPSSQGRSRCSGRQSPVCVQFDRRRRFRCGGCGR
jgi:hypothetical protein